MQSNAFSMTLSPQKSQKKRATSLPKSPEETALLQQVLRSHSALAALSVATHQSLIASMCAYSIGSYQVVVHEHDTAAAFYVVTKGCLEVDSAGERQTELFPGDCFGDSELLYEQPFTFTVKALEPVHLWSLDAAHFRRAVAQYRAETLSTNLEFLRSLPLLKKESEKDIEWLAESTGTQVFRSGSVVISEGAPGFVLYIVREGELVCSVRGEEVTRLGPGDYFGEQAIIAGSSRTAMVAAITDVHLLFLSRQNLQRVFAERLPLLLYHNSVLIAFAQHSVLKQLSQLKELVDLVEMRVVEKDTELHTDYAVVLTGEVQDASGKDFKRLEVAEGVLRTVTRCDLALLTLDSAEACLGQPLQEAVRESMAIAFLRLVPLCSDFSRSQLKSLWLMLREERFPEGSVIFNKGDMAEAVYIVREGFVQVVKDGAVLRTVGRLGFFGERALVENVARSASVVVAAEEVTCYVLSASDFLSLADEAMLQQLRTRALLQNDAVSLERLEALQVLGKGTFGTVCLVRDQLTQALYSLKAVRRSTVRKHKLTADLQREREVLLGLEHPFILKLVRTFKDSRCLYFLTEYVEGPELFNVLAERVRLSEAEVRFYSGCLLLALEHLHKHNILYRDLKPDNVLLDQRGYPKLIDFGLAKRDSERTCTKVGSPHYMAPEMLAGQPYDSAVDYWSLGVLCYEMATGVLPFANDEDDPMAVAEAILYSGSVHFPALLSRKSAIRKLLEVLLSRSPSRRQSESRRFRSLALFCGVDWVRDM